MRPVHIFARAFSSGICDFARSWDLEVYGDPRQRVKTRQQECGGRIGAVYLHVVRGVNFQEARPNHEYAPQALLTQVFLA